MTEHVSSVINNTIYNNNNIHNDNNHGHNFVFNLIAKMYSISTFLSHWNGYLISLRYLFGISFRNFIWGEKVFLLKI